MEQITETLISIFHISHIGLYLAFGLMGAGALVILAMFWKRMRLMNAINSMKKIIRTTKDETEFTAQYETIRGKVLKISDFAHTWQEFEETLTPPIDDIDDPNYRVYRNTKRPSEYFSTASVHHFQIKPFVLPSTFVGLGLLFTFLGLVAALTETGKSFSNNNIEEIQKALEALLLIAGTKFWASVGGLFTSIVVGAFYQLFNNSVRNGLNSLSEIIEKRLTYANAERIAVDQYGHSQRQTQRLEAMSTEITVALGKRISEALIELPPMLSVSLAETMRPVTDELKNVTSNMSNSNQSALHDMANEFADKMAGSSQESFAQVNNQLEKLVSTLESTATKLSGGGDELRAGLEGTISNINETMLGICQKLKETTQEAGGSFKSDAQFASSELKEVILAIKSQQESSVDKITKLTDSLDQVSLNATKSMDTMLEKSGEQLGNAVGEAVSQTSTVVAEALNGLGDDIQDRVQKATSVAQDAFTNTFSDLSQKLDKTSNGLSSVIGDWQKQLADISVRFESISGQLSNQVSEIAKVNTQVAVTGDAFSKSAQTVRDVTIPLTNVTNQLNQASTSISQTLQETITETQNTSETFSSTLKEMAAAVANLQYAWETNGQHLKNVDSELERAFMQITQQMSTSLGTLNSFTKDMDTQLSQSITPLAGFVAEVRELVEEFGEVKARLS
ncbi:MAG: hypothetical protein OFPI_00920 [Osedax symbiont Rs2]|nr:MAG: hypothetical protein OFPI_00920 [Osedax symbiont Rs2]